MTKGVEYSPDAKRKIILKLGLNNVGSNNIIIQDIANNSELIKIKDENITAVAFCPDNKRIVSATGGPWTNEYYPFIKIWDAQTGKMLNSIENKNVAGGHSKGIYTIIFSPDGKYIVSGSLDMHINIWDTETGVKKITLTAHNDVVNDLVFSPCGKYLVSGSDDKTMKIWDIATGKELQTLSGKTDPVHAVAFSPNGSIIATGSGILGDNSDNTIKLWNVNSGTKFRSFTGHSSPVVSIAFSPDGKYLVSGAYNIAKIWDIETGIELKTLRGQKGTVYKVAFSSDGRRVYTQASNGGVKNISVYDAQTGRVLTDVNAVDSYFSLDSISKDKKFEVYCGNDNTIRVKNRQTNSDTLIIRGHSNIVQSAVFSQNNKYIASTSSDGTTRLWDFPSGKEISQLVCFIDGEWICLTPDGYYNASMSGDSHLNVRVGSTITGIDQYRLAFYRPDIVMDALQGRTTPNATLAIQNAASFKPPEVAIITPKGGEKLNAASVELSVLIKDPNQPIQNVKVLVNGRLEGSDEMQKVSGSRGLMVESTEINITEKQNQIELKFFVALERGLNNIEVLANNGYSEGRKSVQVIYTPSAQTKIELPNLYILAIGVNSYDDARITKLNYAVRDAQEILNSFKAQEGKTYRTVKTLLIADDASIKPTRKSIMDNLGFLKQVNSRDVSLLFIAGHGVSDARGNFYFLPSDAALEKNGTTRLTTAVSGTDLNKMLDVPGKKILFIDSCHSGGVSADTGRMAKDLQDRSKVIFASSQSNELSQEISTYRHGVFTYSIIQGLLGAADAEKQGQVIMTGLDDYVRKTVPNITKEQQHPITYVPNGYSNFNVANIK